jgi:hypothetical protein
MLDDEPLCNIQEDCKIERAGGADMSHDIVAKTFAVAVLMVPLAGLPAPAQTQRPAQAPPTAVPYAEAVANAARTLFKALPLPPGGGKVEIVIDPLLDGATGNHTVAAADMGRRLIEIARNEFPRLAVVDFTEEALARKPLLLIGSITALQDAGQVGGKAAVAKPYAIWFTVADIEKREIVAKANARAKPEGVDASPTPSHADSPAWRKDATTQAYLESCRNAKVGEQLSPTYADQLTTASVVASANRAYDSGQTAEALELYRKARSMPGGRQLRVLNGIYTSLARLGGTGADGAFGDIVDYGMENRDLAVKLLFRTGTARFVEVQQARAYPMWLGQIATKTAARLSCVEVVGHTSPTGPAAFNDRLSQSRAEYVRDQLRAAAHGLDNHLLAKGVGSRENIVGTGRDDASDAIDRRVAFKVMDCP